MTNQNHAITLVNQPVSEPAEKTSLKDSLMSFAPLLIIFVIFYFFIIRPQVRKQKEQQNLIKSAKKGDKVIAAGGFIGKIVKEKEGDIIVLEIAPKINVEVLKSSIISIVKK